MRCPTALGVLLAMAAFAEARAAPPPRIGYEINEVAASWQPLEPADVARTVEHAALEVLSKPGWVRLEKKAAARGAVPAAGAEDAPEYRLLIEGRMIDEAETHTVYLTFGPGARTDLPSFRASDTVVLAKLARPAMVAALDASARRAAKELLGVLGPALEAAGARPTSEPPKPLTGGALPWRWPEVRVPEVSSGRASSELYSKRREERLAALRELTSLALLEVTPRQVLERCVLEHFDEDTKLGCLVALRPLSRRLAPTQRVVIAAFRRDASGPIRNEANEQMLYFTGLAQKDAIQAWLESLSKGVAIGPLDQLGDLPNLDLAIAGCFGSAGRRPKYQRSKAACIEALKPVPLARRKKLLWHQLAEADAESAHYLEGAGTSEGSHGTDWQRAMEAMLEGATTWDPEFEELLWKRYQRTLSSSALDVLADEAPPTERLMTRMLEVLQTAGGREPVSALRRIAETSPALAPRVREGIAELIATGNFPKTVSSRELESLVEALGREKK